jgi:hypothetical protein
MYRESHFGKGATLYLFTNEAPVHVKKQWYVY